MSWRYIIVYNLLFSWICWCQDAGLTKTRPIKINDVLKIYWFDADCKIEKIGYSSKSETRSEIWHYFHPKTKSYSSYPANSHHYCCDEMAYLELAKKYDEKEKKRSDCNCVIL